MDNITFKKHYKFSIILSTIISVVLFCWMVYLVSNLFSFNSFFINDNLELNTNIYSLFLNLIILNKITILIFITLIGLIFWNIFVCLRRSMVLKNHTLITYCLLSFIVPFIIPFIGSFISTYLQTQCLKIGSI